MNMRIFYIIQHVNIETQIVSILVVLTILLSVFYFLNVKKFNVLIDWRIIMHCLASLVIVFDVMEVIGLFSLRPVVQYLLALTGVIFGSLIIITINRINISRFHRTVLAFIALGVVLSGASLITLFLFKIFTICTGGC